MRLLADENFNNDILRGLLRANIIDLDFVRVQDTEIYQADDPIVLERAAKDNRILLTHDADTMIGYAYDRVEEGLPMPGVIEVSTDVSIGRIISELLIVLGASDPSELKDRVIYIPLR